jgi:predicted glycoside hydrolase/deacetylase ChbG (UPF0249 family)
VTRWLIVNADDFGLSAGVNAGIVQAHVHGIVGSTSLMVCTEGTEEAVALARAHAGLALGLHLDLWDSVRVGGPDGDEWTRLYARCDETPQAIEAEFARQLPRFRALVGRDPDHLDTHQHVHAKEPAGAAARAMAAALGVPLRGHSRAAYLGGFYGQDGQCASWPQGVSVENLLALIDTLPEGATELGCHPGFVPADDTLGGTMYRVERNAEVATLCDPRVRARVARGDVVPTTFAQLARQGLV